MRWRWWSTRLGASPVLPGACDDLDSRAVLGLGIARQQLVNRRLRSQTLIEHTAHCRDDRHVCAHGLRQLEHFARAVDTFRDVTELLKNVRERAACGEAQTHLAVARQS